MQCDVGPGAVHGNRSKQSASLLLTAKHLYAPALTIVVCAADMHAGMRGVESLGVY